MHYEFFKHLTSRRELYYIYQAIDYNWICSQTKNLKYGKNSWLIVSIKLIPSIKLIT